MLKLQKSYFCKNTLKCIFTGGRKKKKSIETVYHKVILKHTWRW